MSYVVYHIETTRYLDGKASHKTLAGAKRYLTLAVKKAGLNRDDYAIAESADFHNNIEKLVERVNLMSKKPYMERVNTPIYCSPAFESYWSM